MIEIKNLEKSFGKLNVLQGITTTINKGDKVVIVGPSGSGKSTFLRCLNLMETPTGGEIWFEGQQINAPKVNVDKLRCKMGMVFQHFNLFPHLTILQGGGRGKGQGAPFPDRAAGQGQHLSGHAFRWAEAAGGHCPGSGHESRRDAF